MQFANTKLWSTLWQGSIYIMARELCQFYEKKSNVNNVQIYEKKVM